MALTRALVWWALAALMIFKPALAQEAPAAADSPAPTTAAAAPLKILSYNLGLAHGAVAFSHERMPVQLETLKSYDADVMCLQEIWSTEDGDAFIEALKAEFPYSFRQIIEDPSDESTPCGLCKTLRMSKCVNKKCLDKGLSVFECVEEDDLCKGRYDALNDDCKRCLAANTTAAASCAVGGAQAMANEGRNGLLLLSKQPMTQTEYIPLEAFLVTRGALSATIGDTHVMCTHMSADLGMLPYPQGGSSQSWAQEHALQVQALSDKADAVPGCSVLVGDLNTGPTTDTLAAELEANWPLLEQHGFSEAWPGAPCTFCADNVLAGVDDGRWIDHIMFKGCPDSTLVSYERVLDEPISLPGQPEPTNLSDHYGVRAVITR